MTNKFTTVEIKSLGKTHISVEPDQITNTGVNVFGVELQNETILFAADQIREKAEPPTIEPENKCCGTCKFWHQTSIHNKPPLGKCEWRPATVPYWYVFNGSMLFEADGENCPAYLGKVTA